MYYTSSYIVLVPFMLFAMYAQSKVKSTFMKYLKVRSSRGLTGAEIARKILDANDLRNIKIELSNRGTLSDHYDPTKRVVRLSHEVYNGDTISSISVAAHEVGHAIQHSKAYLPLTFRSLLAPVAGFSSKAVMPLMLLGLLLGITPFIDLAIIVFVVILVFQMVTLPVEFNASSRALVELEGLGLIRNEERADSKKVLNAAALTYVAAVAVTIGQILRLLAARGRRR